MNLGVKLDDVREEVLEFLGASDSQNEDEEEPEHLSGVVQRARRNTKSKTPALDSFGRDLTELAARASSTR